MLLLFSLICLGSAISGGPNCFGEGGKGRSLWRMGYTPVGLLQWDRCTGAWALPHTETEDLALLH